MKKTVVIALLFMLFTSGCSRGLTTYEAANGKQKCQRTYIK